MQEGNRFWDGVQAAMPTVMGYLSIGLACGIIAAPHMSVVEMLLMSLLVYAGSAQFAMIALIATQASIFDIAMTVFLINLRLGLMSLHASSMFQKEGLLTNISIGSFLTDESYGVLLGRRLHTEEISGQWMQGNNFASYSAWALGTVVGTALGQLLPNPELFGLDFALVGMFVGIFAAQCFAMLHRIRLPKLLVILAVVAVSFFGLTMVLSKSLAVLFATLIGCSVGVLKK